MAYIVWADDNRWIKQRTQPLPDWDTESVCSALHYARLPCCCSQGPDRGIIPRTVEDIFTFIVNDPEPSRCVLAQGAGLGAIAGGLAVVSCRGWPRLV